MLVVKGRFRDESRVFGLACAGGAAAADAADVFNEERSDVKSLMLLKSSINLADD